MKRMTHTIIPLFLGVALLSATVLPTFAGEQKGSGPGKTRFGIDVTEWSSDTALDVPNGIFPIGGSGQLNGGFVTAERYGIQIAIRAQERFVGPLPSVEVSKAGIYVVATGESSPDRATWNYDWHVDLRGAFGVAKDTTLGDYDLVLVTNIADPLFGFSIPLDLTFGGAIPSNAVLYQSSQNPTFGNSEFDLDAEGVYEFSLVLIPKSFNGPALVAEMSVIAVAP